MDPPVIAVHDGGVDLAHKSLADALVPGRSFDPHMPDPWPDEGDCHHGTLASLMVLGVAPDARIMPVRFSGSSPQRLAASLRYATSTADVVLCAWSLSKKGLAPMLSAVFANCQAVVVAATGPAGLEFPACLPNVLAVSNGLHPNPTVVSVVVVGLPEFEVYAVANGRRAARTRSYQGSSAAAAIVAGLAARLTSRFTPDEVIEALSGRSFHFEDIAALVDAMTYGATP